MSGIEPCADCGHQERNHGRYGDRWCHLMLGMALCFCAGFRPAPGVPEKGEQR